MNNVEEETYLVAVQLVIIVEKISVVEALEASTWHYSNDNEDVLSQDYKSSRRYPS